MSFFLDCLFLLLDRQKEEGLQEEIYRKREREDFILSDYEKLEPETIPKFVIGPINTIVIVTAIHVRLAKMLKLYNQKWIDSNAAVVAAKCQHFFVCFFLLLVHLLARSPSLLSQKYFSWCCAYFFVYLFLIQTPNRWMELLLLIFIMRPRASINGNLFYLHNL